MSFCVDVWHLLVLPWGFLLFLNCVWAQRRTRHLDKMTSWCGALVGVFCWIARYLRHQLASRARATDDAKGGGVQTVSEVWGESFYFIWVYGVNTSKLEMCGWFKLSFSAIFLMKRFQWQRYWFQLTVGTMMRAWLPCRHDSSPSRSWSVEKVPSKYSSLVDPSPVILRWKCFANSEEVCWKRKYICRVVKHLFDLQFISLYSSGNNWQWSGQ